MTNVIFDYYDAGRTETIDKFGETTTFEYDEASRPEKMIYDTGAYALYTYDGRSRIKAVEHKNSSHTDGWRVWVTFQKKDALWVALMMGTTPCSRLQLSFPSSVNGLAAAESLRQKDEPTGEIPSTITSFLQNLFDIRPPKRLKGVTQPHRPSTKPNAANFASVAPSREHRANLPQKMNPHKNQPTGEKT